MIQLILLATYFVNLFSVHIVRPVITELICKLVHHVRPVKTVSLFRLLIEGTARALCCHIVFATKPQYKYVSCNSRFEEKQGQ